MQNNFQIGPELLKFEQCTYKAGFGKELSSHGYLITVYKFD